MPTSQQTISEPVSGMAQIERILNGVADDVRTELAAKGVGAVGERIENAARAFAPMKSGALKASLGTRVIRNPERAKAVAIVGPRRGRFVGGSQLAKGIRGGDQPSKYAHLEEFGHVTVQSRKGGTLRKGTARKVGFVPARPFMRPATMLITPAAAGIMADVIGNGIINSVKRRK